MDAAPFWQDQTADEAETDGRDRSEPRKPKRRKGKSRARRHPLHRANALADAESAPFPMVAFEFRRIRKSLGMTQKQFGQCLGVCDATVRAYELAHRPIPAQTHVAAVRLAQQAKHSLTTGSPLPQPPKPLWRRLLDAWKG